MWPDDPVDFADAPEIHSTFIPWYVFHFIPDAEAEDWMEGWPEEPIGRHFLRHTTHAEPDDWLFVEKACESPFSFLVITAVEPGRGLHLRDVFTGREFAVLEQQASNTLSPGELVFSTVLTFEDAALLLGVGPYAVPPTWHNPLIDLRKKFSRGRTFGRAALFEYDIELRDCYHDVVESLLNPQLPTLVNTDGDPLQPTTIEYELRCSPQAAFDRLKTLALPHTEEELLADAEEDPAGSLRALSFSWVKKGNRKHKHWETTVLGRLAITPGKLTAEVNSGKRATRIRNEIARRLGTDAVLTRSSTQNMTELLSRRMKTGGGALPEPPTPTPEMRQALREMQAAHWEAWLDEKVPALGNQTPRKAARTPEGRERLEALLAEYAWRDTRTPAENRVDIAELRRKLGLLPGG